jgi:hypothetical protein
MMKINVSYSKKVPAESQYSSQSYHCSIEAELPDGLSHEQLQERIHATFATVRQAVEAELHGEQVQAQVQPQAHPQAQSQVQAHPQAQAIERFTHPEPQTQAMPQAAPTRRQQQPHPQTASQASGQNQPAGASLSYATGKQINYLLTLAKRVGWSVQDLKNHCQVDRLEELDKQYCSKLIEQLSGRAA